MDGFTRTGSILLLSRGTVIIEEEEDCWPARTRPSPKPSPQAILRYCASRGACLGSGLSHNRISLKYHESQPAGMDYFFPMIL